MPLVQFSSELFIRSGTEFYTCMREIRGTTNSMLEKCQNFGKVNFILQNLAQLRKNFKNVSLVSFDRWRADRHVTATWQKKTISSTTNTINGQNVC